jgi:transcriptional regulator with XRE-family HTH domain
MQRLADKAGVSVTTIFNLEHCKKKSIQPSVLELISSALNITLEEYINGKI